MHFRPLPRGRVDLVVMAGFLKRITIPDDFTNRVVNIHPGLIPAFCGQGFYGHRVHQAVLDYGAKISGCTVHFADNDYDHGPVILQRRAGAGRRHGQDACRGGSSRPSVPPIPRRSSPSPMAGSEWRDERCRITAAPLRPLPDFYPELQRLVAAFHGHRCILADLRPGHRQAQLRRVG